MNWSQALPLITISITRGLHLDPIYQFKIVIDIPPYQCYRNGFNGVPGYKIQVGRNSLIEVPLKVLQDVHTEAMQNNAMIYNHYVFQYCYPNLYNNKPCYVHTVGKIFTNSTVASQISRTEYQIF